MVDRERGVSLDMDYKVAEAVVVPKDVQGLQKGKDKEAAVAAYVSVVDPFLVEALQNPRHRLTSKWMWLVVLRIFGFAFCFSFI